MNKAKSAVKKSVGRSKPVKKASKPSAVKKPVGLLPEEIRLRGVPLAEIEVLAAAAVRRIKASRKLSASKKVRRLECVTQSLEHARKSGALSYSGADSLRHIHEPPTMRPSDIRRACKI
ncbi:hypothetical protein R80B4_01405 [Fibrobacteres bacterium R8-0-B4]